jgi:hypothetical protein
MINLKNRKMENVKRQKRKVGVAGGFINQMMGNNSSTPVVGEGATELMYSDRHPYEVVKVSDDGSSCEIREMDYEFIGSGYGDERYKLKSNPSGFKKTLEWNERKGCWCYITYSVEIIKSLDRKLTKQFGMWSVLDNLPNGVTKKDIYNENGEGFKLIEGVTKRYKNRNKISIYFGQAEKYQDPHF